MGKVTKLPRSADLATRRSITLELPEFLLRALECRISEANAGATDVESQVSLEHLVELELAEGLSIGEVALLEQRVPGIGAAVSRWLDEIAK